MDVTSNYSVVTAGRKRRRRRINWMPYLFVAPAAIIVFALSVATMFFTFGTSMTNWALNRATTEFIGTENYVKLLRDDQFWASLGHSAVFVGGVIVFSLVVGMLCALALNERFRSRTIIRAIVITPWVLSEVVTGIMFGLLLGPAAGTLTMLAKSIGWDPRFLETATNAMLSLIFVETWRSVGFVMLFILAALQGIDSTLYEAAHIDGASRWHRFRFITLPLTAPTLLITTILLSIGNFNLVTIILTLTGGGPIRHTETTALYMWRESFVYLSPGYGSAIAMTMGMVNAAMALLYIRLLGQYGSTEGK